MLTAFKENKWIRSFGINIVLFLAVIIFLKPVFNSGDDGFLMYCFSGSFGAPPTELVDYSWGWHFILGIPLKNLFALFPVINWYSSCRRVLHGGSCSLI